jgi:hypothetical protein
MYRRDNSNEQDEVYYGVAEDDTLKSRFSKWAMKTYNQQKQAAGNRKLIDWLAIFLPCVRWLTTYNVRPNDYCPFPVCSPPKRQRVWLLNGGQSCFRRMGSWKSAFKARIPEIHVV